eukprot:6529773-Ditylum_brightwellii.AAC.1
MHSHNSPFPPVSHNDKNKDKAAETNASVSCYVRGCTETEDILGYGWKVTGEEQNVSTRAELLSWGAFSKDEVRLSSEKTKFDFSWPRLPRNGTIPHENIHQALEVCKTDAARALGCNLCESPAVLTSKLITGIVVEMMKKTDSVRFFETLLDFR